jgi:hypothetical protein
MDELPFEGGFDVSNMRGLTEGLSTHLLAQLELNWWTGTS